MDLSINKLLRLPRRPVLNFRSLKVFCSTVSLYFCGFVPKFYQEPRSASISLDYHTTKILFTYVHPKFDKISPYDQKVEICWKLDFRTSVCKTKPVTSLKLKKKSSWKLKKSFSWSILCNHLSTVPSHFACEVADCLLIFYKPIGNQRPN